MIIVLLAWLICPIIAASVASSKGRTGFGWFLLGAAFGLFALVAIIALPNLRLQQEQHQQRREELRLLAKIAGEEYVEPLPDMSRWGHADREKFLADRKAGRA